jgi:U4/U6 small nuclear ribonucleoprotein PRP4
MDTSKLSIGKDAINLAIKSGNVNIAGAMHVEVLDLSETSREAQIQHADTLRRFEGQQRARSIVVPTDVGEIKIKLRELGNPITLFGEGPADRRERLKGVIASMELSSSDVLRVQQMMNDRDGSGFIDSTDAGTVPQQNHHQPKKETFYTRASDEIFLLRKDLASYSFERAHNRLVETKRTRESDLLQREDDQTVAILYSEAKKLCLMGSQYADERPLTAVRSNPSGSLFASASLHPVVKVWDAQSLEQKIAFSGHLERVTALAWHPQASLQAGPAIVASTSADGCCLLWDARISEMSSSLSSDFMEDDVVEKRKNASESVITRESMRKICGHHGVVANCEFHPSGRILGTTGHDFSWRLWDVETGQELLLQDGHLKECSAITFQRDGALAFTADWAGIGLLWDLRSGQAVATFQGHVKKIVSSHFNANGFQVATSSVDNMVRIWDLRKKRCGYCLPAHSNIISDVRYSFSGELMLTSSFDGTLKIWGTRDYRLLRVLSGHSGKIMECDFIGESERKIVSAGFDRTIKIWSDKE